MVRWILLCFLLSPLALAQLGFPPQQLAPKLKGKLVGNSIWTAGQEVRIEFLDGLVFGLSYNGPESDLLTAARVVAYGVGDANALGDVVNYLEQNLEGFRNKGPQDLLLGPTFRLQIELKSFRLSVRLSYRLYSAFGPDRNVLGQSGVMIREFSDFECPFCQRLVKEVLPNLKERFINRGQARFSYRHLPLTDIHPKALPLAIASECAAEQGRFYAFHDQVFAGTLEAQAAARLVGLNLERFNRCLSAGKATERVQQDQQVAQMLQLNATPTLFVGPFRLPNPFDLNAYERFLRMARALQMP